MSRRSSLARRIAAATGSDRELDAAIARRFGPDGADDDDDGSGEGADYSASVDACLALLRRVLPGWHWHVGYGATGIFPYAAVRRGEARYEASAGTVPLALLHAIVRAADGEGAAGAGPPAGA